MKLKQIFSEWRDRRRVKRARSLVKDLAANNTLGYVRGRRRKITVSKVESKLIVQVPEVRERSYHPMVRNGRPMRYIKRGEK